MTSLRIAIDLTCFFHFPVSQVKSYDGGRTAPDLIAFLEDPDNPLSGHPPPPPPPEQAWEGAVQSDKRMEFGSY